jgi:ABC-type Fe3+-hydroxamate transport system substrate-binding protein
MTTRALFVAAGLLAASFSPALADSVTAGVIAWDPAGRTITLEDYSQFAAIPDTVAVPAIKEGDVITVDYSALDNGYDTINSITVIRDVAKRLVPATQKGG